MNNLPPIGILLDAVDQHNPGYAAWRAHLQSQQVAQRTTVVPQSMAPAADTLIRHPGPPAYKVRWAPQWQAPGTGTVVDVPSSVIRFIKGFRPKWCDCVSYYPIHCPDLRQMPAFISFARPGERTGTDGINLADIIRLGGEAMQNPDEPTLYTHLLKSSPAMEIPYILVVDGRTVSGPAHIPGINHCEHQPCTRFRIAYSVAIAFINSIPTADLGQARLVTFRAPRTKSENSWIAIVTTQVK
ncbi:hypothetical protein FB45DRAFT_1041194 [Roridomyces roridus]|uniref:Uncharacterized protein n=1 Tax=Roridomyces roridus TaxID=1738132 RepID=A0AAD7F9Z6_9AGAR|nr:hypothetical protein FB45DRAFT_1041194 [Roridomyces roridus]